MAKKVFNLFILDESGSMSGIANQIINSYNEIIQTVKNSQSRHPNQLQFITLVTFNGAGIKTIMDNAPIGMVNRFTAKDYCPDDMTPLWDAVGSSVNRLETQLVTRLSEKNWVFSFIGAGDDVLDQAAKIAIPKGNTMLSAYTDLATDSSLIGHFAGELHEAAYEKEAKAELWERRKKSFFVKDDQND